MPSKKIKINKWLNLLLQKQKDADEEREKQ